MIMIMFSHLYCGPNNYDDYDDFNDNNLHPSDFDKT